MSEIKFTPSEEHLDNKERALAELNTPEMRMYIIKSARMIKNDISDADAEDMAQRTMLIANQELQKGKFHYKSKLKTWVYRIAENLILSDIRHSAMKQRRGFVDGMPEHTNIGDEKPNAEQILLQEEHKKIQETDIQNLKSDIQSLPVTYKNVMELFIQGIKPPEIAIRLNVPKNTVNTRIRRARKMLLAKAYGKDKPTK